MRRPVERPAIALLAGRRGGDRPALTASGLMLMFRPATGMVALSWLLAAACVERL